MSFIQKYYLYFTRLITKGECLKHGLRLSFWCCDVGICWLLARQQMSEEMNQCTTLWCENTSVFTYEKENYIVVEMGKNETRKSRITHLSTLLSAGRYTDFRMKEFETHKPKSPDEIMYNVSLPHREMSCAHRSMCVSGRRFNHRDEMCGYLDTPQRKATFTLHLDHLL